MQTSTEPVYFQVNPTQGDFCGIRIREDVLFSDAKGKPNAKARKRAEKLFMKLQSAFRLVLEKDECVYLAVEAQTPMSALEQVTMHWAMMWHYRCVLLVTDRRLLHFKVKRDGTWADSVKQLRWADAQTLKAGGSLLGRYLKIVFANGKKETYQRISNFDGKRLKAVLPGIKEHAPAQTTSHQGFEHLCPVCVSPLQHDNYTCVRCGTTFKDVATLRKMILLPGGGYFYCGMTAMGVLLAFAELFFLLEIVLMLGIARSGSASIDDAGYVAGLFTVLILFDKGLSYLHCRTLIREFILKERKAMGAGATA